MICTAQRRDLIISGRCMAQASRSGIKVLDYNFVQGLRPIYERVFPGVYRWLSKTDIVAKEWRP